MKEGMRTERVKVSAHAIVAFDLLLVVLLALARCRSRIQQSLERDAASSIVRWAAPNRVRNMISLECEQHCVRSCAFCNRHSMTRRAMAAAS